MPNTEKSSALKKSPILDNRLLCMLWLFIGVGYITFFGLLKNPFENTASVIAMDYPRLYWLWVLFTIIALYLNITYMYRRFEYPGKAGRVCMYLSFACIIMTIIVPHAEPEEDMLGTVIHWSSALLFGVFSAAAIILFLYYKGKTNRRYKAALISFAGVLALMILLLILFAENGMIEKIPMWYAYFLLFTINFTGLYEGKKAAVKA